MQKVQRLEDCIFIYNGQKIEINYDNMHQTFQKIINIINIGKDAKCSVSNGYSEYPVYIYATTIK